MSQIKLKVNTVTQKYPILIGSNLISKLSKILEEIRSLFILIVIVLTLKVTIFELYIVPTGSM